MQNVLMWVGKKRREKKNKFCVGSVNKINPNIVIIYNFFFVLHTFNSIAYNK